MLKALLILVFVALASLPTARDAAAQVVPPVGPVGGFYYAFRGAYAVFCLFLCEEEQPVQAPKKQPKPDEFRPASNDKGENTTKSRFGGRPDMADD
jgi:hypothetical protein